MIKLVNLESVCFLHHICRFYFCGGSQSLNEDRLCHILVPRARLTHGQKSMTRVAGYVNGLRPATADQNLASEREQNAKCVNVMFMRVLWVF